MSRDIPVLRQGFFVSTPVARATAAALAVAALLGTAGAARAETLLEVFDAARQYDAAYQSARAQALSVDAKADEAHAVLRPQVDLTGSATGRDTHKDPSTAPGSVSIGTLTLQAKQTLWNRANGLAADEADKNRELAAADLQYAEQDLIVRTAQAYFDVLAASDTLAAAKASQKAIAEQLASAKRNFEVGTATITDTREAQARADLANAQTIAAENDLVTKRITLDQLVGRTGMEPAPMARNAGLPPLDSTAADWVRSSETSPNVRKAAKAKEIADLEVSRAKAGHLPTFDAVGTVTAGKYRGIDGLAGTADPDQNYRNSTVGVQMSLPIFAGGGINAQVREAAALQDKARADLDAARRTISQGTQQAFYGVQSGQAQVKALEAAEASSKLALDATLTGYKVGVRVNLDVLNAQTQLFNTQRDLAKARYDVLVNSLKLRQVAGTLSPADLIPINALIQPGAGPAVGGAPATKP